MDERGRTAARDSLRGLALGDGFRGRWFHHHRHGEAIAMIKARRTPLDQTWHWTDDTAIALAILHVLHTRGSVEPQDLAESFTATYDVPADTPVWKAADILGNGLELCELLPQWTGRLWQDRDQGAT